MGRPNLSGEAKNIRFERGQVKTIFFVRLITSRVSNHAR